MDFLFDKVIGFVRIMLARLLIRTRVLMLVYAGPRW